MAELILTCLKANFVAISEGADNLGKILDGSCYKPVDICFSCHYNFVFFFTILIPSLPYPLPPGASTLDPEMCGRYKLSVMVKDMAGKANSFFTTGIVTVEVTGNTWASPEPVRFQENLPGPYPIPISEVRHKPNYHLLP